jgi:hypothetical protein
MNGNKTGQIAYNPESASARGFAAGPAKKRAQILELL